LSGLWHIGLRLFELFGKELLLSQLENATMHNFNDKPRVPERQSIFRFPPR
jgi:hypothetical protein